MHVIPIQDLLQNYARNKIVGTQKLKLWQNSKNQILTNKKLKCDQTCEGKKHKPKLWNRNLTKIVKNFKNSNCDKTRKLKLWQNSKNQIMTKLKKNIKLWQNSKSQIVTVVIVTVLTVVVIVTYFSKNNSTPWQLMPCSQGSVSRFL